MACSYKSERAKEAGAQPGGRTIASRRGTVREEGHREGGGEQ